MSLFQGNDRREALNQRRSQDQHLEHWKKIARQTIHSLSLISELRDMYTSGHQKRLSELALDIGEKLQLDSDKLEGLQFGALLHDLGKIFIPYEILYKPEKLTHSEFELIKEHPTKGYLILKNIDFPWPIADIVHQHHERCDGSGYPNNLTKNQILIESQIVAVADIVDSMISHRPYRPGIELHIVLTELSQYSGIYYHEEIVDACLELFKSENYYSTYLQHQSYQR